MASCSRRATGARSGSSKTVTVIAFLVLMEVVALPVFALLYAPLDAATIGAVLLADIGIAAIGSLLSAMALASRTRELILPLLFLPLAVPIVVGGVGASIADEPGALHRLPRPLRRHLCDHLVGRL